MRRFARVLCGVFVVGMVGMSGCATWTPEQRAAWDDVARGLQQLGAASEAARLENDLRQLQREMAAIRLQQAMHQAMQPPFPFGR